MNENNHQNNYGNNIRLEKKFAQQIKAILGMVFIGQNPVLDKTEATDFLILRIKPFTVACRLRTYGYFLHPKWTNQFTIRCELSSGGKTEITKIREGYADYLFYGFVDEAEENIIKYFIGDLDVFRNYEQGMKIEICKNKDKYPSKLAAYAIKDFPSNFIIKQYNR